MPQAETLVLDKNVYRTLFITVDRNMWDANLDSGVCKEGHSHRCCVSVHLVQRCMSLEHFDHLEKCFSRHAYFRDVPESVTLVFGFFGSC